MTTFRATVHLTQTPYTAQQWAGDGFCSRFGSMYATGTQHPFRVVPSPREADFIVYCEAYQESEQVFAPKLRSEALVAEFPEKVFVISSEDRPLGFLPGIYTSMPLPRFDPFRFRAGCYPGEINPQIGEAERERNEHTPRLLFSFIGARTAAVRGALFANLTSTERWLVRETGNTEFNIRVDDPAKLEGQRSYLRTILDSHFVLCPRGFGTASFRLFETMRLGRAPVILADHWVPPSGPAWLDCSIRIAENRIADLPDILAARLHEAADLGRRAREEWERWFSPAVYASRCLEWIDELRLARVQPEQTHFQRWPEMIRQAQASKHRPGRLRRTLGLVRRLLPQRSPLA